MKKEGCPYCSHDVSKFGIIIFETEISQVIAFKDQAHRGRMIVAYKNDHVGELRQLNTEDRNAFMKDVADVANAIQNAFHPDRINYGAYGDELGHLHIHLVPKYKGGFEWNTPFAMNNGNYLSDEEVLSIGKKVEEEYRKLVK